MYHNSDKITNFDEAESDKHTIKSSGSYYNKPLIPNSKNQKVDPLSYKRTIERYVFKAKHKRKYTKLNITRGQSTLKFLQLNYYSDKAKLFLRYHLRISLKKYLARRYYMPSFMVPAEAFQCMRSSRPKQKQQFQSKILYLSKPYFNANIPMLFQNKDQPKNPEISDIYKKFSKKEIQIIALELISCAISAGGLDNFFMTSSNVYIHLNELTINYSSLTGIAFVNCQERITPLQFTEIYPYLTSYVYERGTKIMQRGDPQQLNRNWSQIRRFRIRSILIVLLCIIVERDIYWRQNEQNINKRSSVESKIRQLPKKFKSFLESEKIKIARAQKSLIDAGCMYNRKHQKFQSLLSLFEDVLADQKQQKQISYEYLLGFFTKKYQAERDPSQEEMYLKLHTLLFEKQSEEEKLFYRSRKLDSNQLFIPVKYEGLIIQLIQLQYWWDIFKPKIKLEDIMMSNEHFFSTILGEILFYDSQNELFSQYLKLSNLGCEKPTSQILQSEKQWIQKLKKHLSSKIDMKIINGNTSDPTQSTFQQQQADPDQDSQKFFQALNNV